MPPIHHEYTLQILIESPRLHWDILRLKSISIMLFLTQTTARPEEREGTNEKETRGGGLFSNWFRGEPQLEEQMKALEILEETIMQNRNGGIRWVDAALLPPLDASEDRPLLAISAKDRRRWGKQPEQFFQIKRRGLGDKMAWSVSPTASDKDPL